MRKFSGIFQTINARKLVVVYFSCMGTFLYAVSQLLLFSPFPPGPSSTGSLVVKNTTIEKEHSAFLFFFFFSWKLGVSVSCAWARLTIVSRGAQGSQKQKQSESIFFLTTEIVKHENRASSEPSAVQFSACVCETAKQGGSL